MCEIEISAMRFLKILIVEFVLTGRESLGIYHHTTLLFPAHPHPNPHSWTTQPGVTVEWSGVE
jgi:hypothetical protein